MIPTDIPGSLKGWWKADAESFAEGDPVGWIVDHYVTNHLNDYGGVAANRPTFRKDRTLFGGPAFYHEGGDYLLTGNNFSTIMGSAGSNYTFIGYVRLWYSGYSGDHTTQGTNPTCLTFGGGWDGACIKDVGAGPALYGAFFTDGTFTHTYSALVPANYGEWTLVMLYRSGSTAYLALGDCVTLYPHNAGVVNLNGNGKPGCGSYSLPNFAFEWCEAALWNAALTQAQREGMQEYFWGRHGRSAAAASVPGVRDISSRYLRGYRRPLPRVTIATPSVYFQTVPMLGDVQVTDEGLPSVDGKGWGHEPWRRGTVRVVGRTLDLNLLTTKLLGLDLRELHCTYWDTGVARETPSLEESGPARMPAAARRTCTRGSPAFVDNPAVAELVGVVSVVPLISNVPKQTPYGMLVENGEYGHLLQSAFGGGLTSWATAGTGSNGSAIATDASAVALFPSTTSPAAIKITAGNPIHASDLYLGQTSPGTVDASTPLRVTIDYLNDNGAVLYWALQRGSNSQWFRASDSTWQASVQWNALPGASVPSRYDRVISAIDTVAATARLQLGVPTSGGTPGGIHHVFFAQVSAAKSGELCGVSTVPYSRVVTTAAAGMRQRDVVRILDQAPYYVFPYWGGTWRWTFRPLWAAADVEAGGERVLWARRFDASNSVVVRYSKTNARVEAVLTAAGVAYTAYAAFSPTAGVEYKMAARVVSAHGDWGLSAYTIDLFIGGAKGTAAVAAALRAPGSQADPYLYQGAAVDGSKSADGYFRDVEGSRFVLSDAELVAATT